MSLFKNIGRTTTAITDTVVVSAEVVSETAKSAKISASVLTIKAKSLKEEAVVEANMSRLESIKKYKELKKTLEEEADELEKLDAEFDELMKNYE